MEQLEHKETQDQLVRRVHKDYKVLEAQLKVNTKITKHLPLLQEHRLELLEIFM
jgi:hypothetical protein